MSEISVQWNEVVKRSRQLAILDYSMFPLQLSRDEYCIHVVNYTVVLMDSALGVIVEQVEVGSDSCEDGICSTSIFPSPSNQVYNISVFATNILGSSTPVNFDRIICE